MSMQPSEEAAGPVNYTEAEVLPATPVPSASESFHGDGGGEGEGGRDDLWTITYDQGQSERLLTSHQKISLSVSNDSPSKFVANAVWSNIQPGTNPPLSSPLWATAIIENERLARDILGEDRSVANTGGILSCGSCEDGVCLPGDELDLLIIHGKGEEDKGTMRDQSAAASDTSDVNAAVSIVLPLSLTRRFFMKAARKPILPLPVPDPTSSLIAGDGDNFTIDPSERHKTEHTSFALELVTQIIKLRLFKFLESDFRAGKKKKKKKELIPPVWFKNFLRFFHVNSYTRTALHKDPSVFTRAIEVLTSSPSSSGDLRRKMLQYLFVFTAQSPRQDVRDVVLKWRGIYAPLQLSNLNHLTSKNILSLLKSGIGAAGLYVANCPQGSMVHLARLIKEEAPPLWDNCISSLYLLDNSTGDDEGRFKEALCYLNQVLTPSKMKPRPCPCGAPPTADGGGGEAMVPNPPSPSPWRCGDLDCGNRVYPCLSCSCDASSGYRTHGGGRVTGGTAHAIRHAQLAPASFAENV